MREWMKLVEMVRYPSWLDQLNDAVNNAQVGFHFEEGGCWGMAAALNKALPGSSILVIKQNGHPAHAMVRLGDLFIDWNGVAKKSWPGEVMEVSPEQLAEIAEQYDCAFYADEELAQELIANAQGLN